MLIDMRDGLLERYFDGRISSALASAVVQAYDTVSKLDARLLYGPESQGIGGHLRKAAVAAFIKEIVEVRGLPFHPYAVTTGPYDTPHLLLMSNDQRIAFSVNQVKKHKAHPRRAKYRDQLIGRNLPSLAFDLFNPEGACAVPEEGWVYAMLTHGYGSSRPNFVGIGIPLSDGRWVSVKNILPEASTELFVPEETVEKIVKPILKPGLGKELSEERGS